METLPDIDSVTESPHDSAPPDDEAVSETAHGDGVSYEVSKAELAAVAQATAENEAAAPMAPAVEPNPRLIVFPKFHSQFLPSDRDITVYVPPGYEATDRRYPVLYMHDGQNLFNPATSYVPGRIWNVQGTADRLIEAGEIEPLIVVGIANTGKQRLGEYTPTENYKLGGGNADLYGRLIIEELKPMIDAGFRTLPDAENTGMAGSSLGGLVTLYLGLSRPDVFRRLAVLSPSIWWDHKIILSFVKDAMPKPPVKIWLDAGTKEGTRTIRDAALLNKLLTQQGWKDGEDLMYLQVPGGEHDEASWAARVEPFLRFLFPVE
jgi:predicted alpha/beta superfamily hydrolase